MVDGATQYSMTFAACPARVLRLHWQPWGRYGRLLV